MEHTYQERIFSGLLALLPGLAGLALLVLFVYNLVSGTAGAEPSPWFFLGMGLFMLLVALNFAFLTIRISPAGVTARFGIFSYHLPAGQIAGFYQDKDSSLAYGGFGFRHVRVNGKWRTVYNVVNAPRVVVQRRSSDREYVFSTRNPEGAMQALQEVAGVS